MSEEEKRRFFGLLPARKSYQPPAIETRHAQGLSGAIESYSRKRAAERVEKEQIAKAGAYKAGIELAEAQADWAKARGRLNEIDKIIEVGEMEVISTWQRQQMELAENEKGQEFFQAKYESEKRRLEADRLDAERWLGLSEQFRAVS